MNAADLISNPWVEWTVAIAVAILFARFCLLPVAVRMRVEAKAWIEKLTASHRTAVESRQNLWRGYITEATGDRYMAAGAEGRHLPFALRRLLRRLYKKLTAADSRFKRLSDDIEKLLKAGDNHNIDPSVITAALNNAQELKQQTAGVGTAWLELVVAGFLTLAVVAANTAMLSRILKEVLNLSSSLAVLGIELNYLIALILTLIEVGVGFVFSRLSAHAKEGGGRFSIGPVFTLFLTGCFSLFEGMNYSRVGSQAGSVTIPLVGYQMDASSIYFLFGFGIVWSLFLLGHLLEHGATRVVEGTAPKRLVKLLRLASRIASALPRAQQAISKGLEAAIDTHALDELRKELDRVGAESNGTGVASQTEALNESEVRRLIYQAGSWALAATAVIAVILLTGVQTFTFLVPEVGVWVPWALASGLAFTCAAAGALWSANAVIYRHDTEVIVEYESWQRWASCALLALVIGTYIWGLVGNTGLLRVPWTLNFVLAVSLAAIASRLYPMLHLAVIWLRSLGHAIAGVVEYIMTCFVRLLYAAIVTIQFLSMIIGLKAKLAKPEEVSGKDSGFAHAEPIRQPGEL